MKQEDLDEAVNKLPSPDDVKADMYIIPVVNADCRFVFRKERIYVTPQRVHLVMWALKEIKRL